MKNQRREKQQELLQNAMGSLIQNPNFQVFMETVRDLKDGAVNYAVTHTSVKDERETLVALGEIRAYLDLLAIADAALAPIAENQPDVPA